jgi:hypothetical protein
MKIAEVKSILDATVLHGEDQLQSVVTAGGAADLMEDVLAAAAKGCVLLTGVTTDHVMRTAKIVGVGGGHRSRQKLRGNGTQLQYTVAAEQCCCLWPAATLYMNESGDSTDLVKIKERGYGEIECCQSESNQTSACRPARL